jgi:hypothetical protein
MARIGANDPHDPSAADHLAFVTDLFNGSSNLHFQNLITKCAKTKKPCPIFLIG